MMLEKLRLTNFKNYAAQSFEFSERLNCLVGRNGQGKTNLLDAIHFLSITKSASGLLDRNLVRHGEEFFRLEADFQKDGRAEKVVAKFQAGGKKTFERDGAEIERMVDHIGQFPSAMVAPDDVRLVQDGSEDRRRFLDMTLSQVSAEYLRNLLIFNQLHRQRNAILKSFLETKSFDPALLEAVERQMPAPASFIFSARKRFVEQFEPLFQKFYAAISGGQESMKIAFSSDLLDEKTGLEKSLAELFEKNLSRDRALGRSTAGPQRDDLLFLFSDENAVKKFASQGQLKSFLLALRLAQCQFLKNELGHRPLLLLDDIFDKLDPERVGQLIDLILNEDFGQIFLTDSHENRVAAMLENRAVEHRIFIIENGRVAVQKN